MNFLTSGVYLPVICKFLFQLIYSETTNHIPVVIQISASEEGQYIQNTVSPVNSITLILLSLS